MRRHEPARANSCEQRCKPATTASPAPLLTNPNSEALTSACFPRHPNVTQTRWAFRSTYYPPLPSPDPWMLMMTFGFGWSCTQKKNQQSHKHVYKSIYTEATEATACALVGRMHAQDENRHSRSSAGAGARGHALRRSTRLTFTQVDAWRRHRPGAPAGRRCHPNLPPPEVQPCDATLTATSQRSMAALPGCSSTSPMAQFWKSAPGPWPVHARCAIARNPPCVTIMTVLPASTTRARHTSRTDTCMRTRGMRTARPWVPHALTTIMVLTTSACSVCGSHGMHFVRRSMCTACIEQTLRGVA